MAVTKNIDISNVTREQLDRCTRIVDPHTMEAFYLVLSESQDLVEYKVTYVRLPSKHYTCTCPAGLNGFARCKDGVCKHVKWAVAAADEYKALEQALAERDAKRAADAAKLAKIRRLVDCGLSHEQALMAADNHDGISDAELVRVYGAKPKKVTGRGRTDNKVFSLMR